MTVEELTGAAATIATLADDLLSAAAAALHASSPLDVPDLRYRSWNEPVYPGCSYLAVWVSEFRPTADPWPTPMAVPQFNCQPPEWKLTLTLKLRRCGYPILTRPLGLPSGAEIDAFAANLMGDEYVLASTLPQDWADGVLFIDPTAPDGMPADMARLSVLWGAIASKRQADVAGLDWPISLRLSRLCAPDVLRDE